MRSLLKRNRQIYLMLLFPVLGGLYFCTQFMGLEYHVVHVGLDDRIPFLPAFVVPYILWYAYVPVTMLYMCFKDRDVFYRQAATLFPGAFVCVLIFMLYPPRIDFRPDAAGPGVFRALCRIIYASDQPVNVLPSLHCFETTAIHLASFGGAFGRRHKAMRAASGVLAVLICLSTLFIRQHSVLDLLAGCGLVAVTYTLAVLLQTNRKGLHADHKTF